MNIKKEYTNGEVTIIWQPGLCQHAGICTKTLPNVYHPKEKPWITAENATTEELMRLPLQHMNSGNLICIMKKKVVMYVPIEQ